MQTEDIPFPTPLLVHPPHDTKYPWGASLYPPGSLVNMGTCHFMQPNSLEFRPAQEWRTFDMRVAEWKQAMSQMHQDELVKVMKACINVGHLSIHLKEPIAI